MQSSIALQARGAAQSGTAPQERNASRTGEAPQTRGVSRTGAAPQARSASQTKAPSQARAAQQSTAAGKQGESRPPENAIGRKKKRAALPEEVIVLDHVVKSYSTGAPALNGISLKVKRGEFVFIVGDSGSGKSTLIKLLLRELLPTEGGITVNGTNVVRLRRRKIPKFRRGIGVVFQDFRLLKDRNVYDNVAFAQLIIQAKARDIRKNVPMMLSLVGLAGKYKAKPKQLSGGEQQRVALARALVNNPPILLADEPTGNLDPKNSWEIMKLLEEINEKGTTVLVVTHNREIVNAMKKRVITMKKGVIVSDEEQGAYIDED
ncbi:MAG: cell division ATP-binding protein FtsE [Lachnospiraceae bacterium]|nr:cell division ATP-binding protein FtsE [Lachnospiraceae bacterium]MBD5482573.1 cell division ATP-binding protein FtsE [Lachnospiraceae bacterium]